MSAPNLGDLVLYCFPELAGEKAERPAMVVKVYPNGLANLQVLLDGGNDRYLPGLQPGDVERGWYWATSCEAVEDPAVPQATKYRPRVF